MIRVPIQKEKTGNAILLIPVAALAGMVGLALFWMGGADRRNADQIVSKIEGYRLHEGHLPNPEDQQLMKALGFKPAAGWIPDYEPLDSSSYRITLLGGLDGPFWIYESKPRAWRYGYP
ncbi:hypothetical protein [Brevifollis gellanilyticus]|uniref:Type II secretion system protein GspG C-terminal domain-containing protein n=1 Tax=Brevifollis gellanilyticus TaxID=748831 RepID=A0A512MD36_9BACT|nr:hypothetical protein [Brevifollis gellanilyticus]GEP44645.1 hypothetical protein BGE01nite_39360 [Brevifollis gellanilyticus]